MTRPLVALMAAVTLIACSDTTDPSLSPTDLAISQGKVRNDWTPWEGRIPNHCNGDTIYVVGKIKRLRTITEDGAGGYHMSFHRNWKGTGTGELTGNVYNINFPINWTENAKGPFPYTFNRIWYNNVTCRGKCPTQLFGITDHLTINANGEITSERSTYHLECKGP